MIFFNSNFEVEHNKDKKSRKQTKINKIPTEIIIVGANNSSQLIIILEQIDFCLRKGK